MKKVFYLKTCSTCRKILNRFDLSDWNLRELKSKPLTESELQDMFALTHSYEKLFSKRSMQIKARSIDLKSLKEDDVKNLLLEHYSFLKRPIFITGDDIFIGNDPHTLHNFEQYFNGE
jgi:arsenate reductase-like glutaredoxin family protein